MIQISQLQKKQILEREFYDLDIRVSDRLSKQDLQQFLDKKCGGNFDVYLFDQLFGRLDKDAGQKVLVSDFIKVFLEAEEIMQSRIENCKTYLEDYNRQRREVAQKLQDTQGEENLNQYGIMHNSKLTIQILQYITTQQLPQDISITVIVRCGDQQQESVGQYNSMQNIFQFMDRLEFGIESGMEDIQIEVQSQSLSQLTQPQYIQEQLIIPLNKLKDQNKHQENYQLYNKSGNIGNGEIQVQLEWIYSKNKYLKERVNKWDQQIQTTNDDLQDYTQTLQQLRQPFQQLNHKYQQQIQNQLMINSPQQTNRNLKQQQQSGEKQNSLMYSNITQHNQQPDSYVSPYAQQQYQQQQQEYGVEVKAVKMQSILSNSEDSLFITRKLISVFLLLSLLISLYKPQFLDFIIVFYFIENYQKKQISPKYTKIYLYMFGFSILQELFWLLLFAGNYWNQYSQLSDLIEERALKRFVVVLCWIGLFLKISILIGLKFLWDSQVTQISRQDQFKDPEYLYSEQQLTYSNNNQNTSNNQLYSPTPLYTQKQQQQQDQVYLGNQQQQNKNNDNSASPLPMNTPNKVDLSNNTNTIVTYNLTPQQPQLYQQPPQQYGQTSNYYPEKVVLNTLNTPTPVKQQQQQQQQKFTIY